jgi:predicted  nucleic acid-binding Zn-ribbon protein
VSEGFVALRALAETDEERSRLDQARHSLPAKVEGDELMAQAQGLMAAKAMLDDECAPLAEILGALETEIEGLRSRREQIIARLSASVGAGKELEAMDAEVTHLSETIDDRETTELELLEQIAPLEDRLGRIEAELHTLRVRHQVLEGEFKTQSAELEAARALVLARRSELAAVIEPTLLLRYERIAARTGASGACLVNAGHCGGCHIELASGEIDALRHLPLDELGTCEQCGRLLLRTQQVN